MIGSIISGAMGVAGSIFGGIKAAQAAKKAKKNIEVRRAANKSWYDRRYNEDGLQRADAQRILTQTERNIRNRNRAAAGTAAVMGGTQESVAATKAVNSEATAEAAARIAANADARKDSIEQQYRAKDDAYNNELNNIENQRAMNIAQAVGGTAQAAGSLGAAFEGNQNSSTAGIAEGDSEDDDWNSDWY